MRHHVTIADRAARRKGFTLMEIMVVLVIFSMIAIGSLSVFVHLLHSQQALEERGRRLEHMQVLLLVARHDLSQIIPGLNASGQNGTPTGHVINVPQGGPFLFVRNGWFNPLGETRSLLANVSYTPGNRMIREDIWPFAQANVSIPPVSRSFDEAVNMQFRAVEKLPDPIPFSTAGPLKVQQDPLIIPLAVEATFNFYTFGEVRELIPMVQTP